jgi:hypothetical protein
MIQSIRVEVTTLDKCEPGDLVRELQFPTHDGFSIVTRDPKEENGVAWLLHLSEWMRAERMDDCEAILVLRYLDTLRFDVDHLGPVEVKANRFFEAPGALVFSQKGQFLNARIGIQGAEHGLLQVDLNTSLCRKYAEELKGAYFGRWSVSLMPDIAMGLDPLVIYEHEVALA